MKTRKRPKIGIWIFLIIVIIAAILLVKKFTNKTETTTDTSTESTVIKTDIINTVSKSSYIATALEENKELHATYYFEEIYCEKNQKVAAGDNILKYTNGTYMTAPYNCVITDLSIPNSGEMCTNKHYITMQSTDTLKISLEVDEDELDTIYVGQESSILIDTLQNKTITGYVTKIDNTATYSSSGSTFGVEVEFQNDGEILLGMSAKCSIILEKVENVIAVAKEAITNQNGSKTVTIKLADGTTKDVEVETGISNDAYTEVKNGLSEGDVVIIEETTSSSADKMMQKMQQGGSSQGQKDFTKDGSSSSGGGTPPEMPSGASKSK